MSAVSSCSSVDKMFLALPIRRSGLFDDKSDRINNLTCHLCDRKIKILTDEKYPLSANGECSLKVLLPISKLGQNQNLRMLGEKITQSIAKGNNACIVHMICANLFFKFKIPINEPLNSQDFYQSIGLEDDSVVESSSCSVLDNDEIYEMPLDNNIYIAILLNKFLFRFFFHNYTQNYNKFNHVKEMLFFFFKEDPLNTAKITDILNNSYRRSFKGLINYIKLYMINRNLRKSGRELIIDAIDGFINRDWDAVSLQENSFERRKKS